MKKMMMICLLVLDITAAGNAQDAMARTVPVQSFEAGGTSIAIPSPTAEMGEVGYDNRGLMGIFVPATNRLIAAFTPTQDLSGPIKRADDLTITKYALVEVSRRGEYRDISTSDFREATASVGKRFGEGMLSSSQEAQGEFRLRMESLDLEKDTVNFGKPLRLGIFFSKPDAYGIGMIVPVSMGDKKRKMGMGIALVRVKQRLLFVYLYAAYENEGTTMWLRKKTEDWADAILKANAG